MSLTLICSSVIKTSHIFNMGYSGIRNSRWNEERDSNEHRGPSNFNPDRGFGRSVYGSRGKRGSYRGISRGGFVNSYRRKPSGLSSLGTKENSGQASVLIQQVVVPSESNAVSIKEHRGPAVLGNHSGTVLPLSSSGADGSSIRLGNSDETCNNDNLVLLSDSHMEEGELKDDAVVYEFDGELDGFAEFAGDFEFGIGDEYSDDLGEEDTPFSEISETVKSAVVGEEVAIAVVPSVWGSVKDPLIGGNYSGDEMIVSKDKEVVKDGKDKEGKVALPKLPGCP